MPPKPRETGRLPGRGALQGGLEGDQRVLTDKRVLLGEISGVWRAKLLARRQRFTVLVVDDGGGEKECHLHDPGRLYHLLVPGATIYARSVWRPGRKTKCDVVAVEAGSTLVLEDTRFANRFFPQVAPLLYGGIEGVEEEVVVPGTRLDFILHTVHGTVYVEVKSTNLVEGRVALFPDAPSRRALRQLDSLLLLSKTGARAELVFIVLRGDPELLRPNWRVDQAFARRLCGYRQAIGLKAVKLEPVVEGEAVKVFYGGRIPVKC